MNASILMQKQVKDNAEDLQKEFLDMKNWEEEMKRKDDELKKESSGKITFPPIRSKNKTKTKTKSELAKQHASDTKPKRIQSYDYSAWDKYAEKALKEIDNEEKSDDSEGETMSKEELEKAHKVGTKHKNEGNVFVQQQRWTNAIECYTQAIKAFPYDAIFYANRALCQLKLENFHSAESDCSAAIQLDETYVKAYLRRATARMNLKQYNEANDDLEKALKLEPSNKEAKTLLTQIVKKIKISKPDPVKETTESLLEQVSVEKKIGEKLCNNTLSNVKVLDNKNISDNKPIEEDKNVEKDMTNIAIKGNERDFRIPDWLVEKNDVIVIEPIKKPPHLRSKKLLTRIPVEEADFTIIQENITQPDKTMYNKNEPAQLKEVHKDNNTKKSSEVITVSTSSQDINNIPPAPKTSVQFLMNWKTNKSLEFRYKYLKQLAENSLPKIFQDSMEFDIFSEILEVLRIEFIKGKEPVFSYLKDLSEVKRFRALIMFISNKEKEYLRTLLKYSEEVENVAIGDIEILKDKYEI